MKIEFGKKSQIIIALLLMIGAAGAIAEYGNNINIPGNFTGINGIFSGDISANDITVSGTVDGVDIASSINQGVRTTDSPTFNNIVVSGNVDGVDISASINQGVRTTDSPTFLGLNVTNITAKNVSGIYYDFLYTDLQEAINATPTNGELRLTKIWNVTSPIVLYRPIKLVGTGIYGSGIRQADGANIGGGAGVPPSTKTIVDVGINKGQDGSVQLSYGYILRDFQIDFNEANQTFNYSVNMSQETPAALQIDVISNSIFENLLIKNAPSAGIFAFQNQNNTFRNIIFENNTNGIVMDSGDANGIIAKNNLVEDNFFLMRNNPRTGNGVGIWLEAYIRDTLIQNNRFFNMNNNAISGDATTNGSQKIIGNYIYGVYGNLGNGIDMQFMQNGIISSNTIYNAGGLAAIQTISGNNNTITNNIIENSTLDGIFYAGNNNIILGNKINSTLNGIRESSGGYGTIIENNFVTLSAAAISITNGVAKNNYGVSPYDFGNKATAPAAFGAGDKYYDTDVNYYCFYNSTAWVDVSTGLVTCS